MRRLRIGDNVKIIAGKYKGQQGKVIAFTKDDRVIVEGIALQSKFIKKGLFGKGQPGQIIKKEGSIHKSNVMVICPVCSQTTRITITNKDGKKFRQCKKCGALIDIEKAKEDNKANESVQDKEDGNKI